MKTLSYETKIKLSGMGTYPWNTTLYTAMGCQAVNNVLGLINQIIYNTNENPRYNTAKIYDDTSSKMYLRAGKNALSSTISYGSSYF